MASVCRMASEGMAAWQAGRAQEAAEAFQTLVTLDAESDLWPCLLCRAELQQGHAQEALAAAETGLARATFHAELLLLRAKAQLLLGSKEAARASLVRARALGGLPDSADKELRAALAELGEEAALPPGKTAPAARPPPAAAAPPPQAAAGGASGSSAPAKVAAPPQDAAAVAKALKAALASEKKEHFLDARAHCKEALGLQPGLPEAVLCLARMELANGQGKAAAKLLKDKHPAVLKQRPQGIEALCLLAKAWELAGDYDAAATELEAALRLAKQVSQSPVAVDDISGRLARAQWKGEDQDTARGLAQKVLETSPNQREACEVACEILMQRDDHATAISLMLRCLINHRNEPSQTCAALVLSVMKTCPVEMLLRVLTPKDEGEQKSSVAEVVAYVGLIMKECSEVPKSCQLYRTAVLHAPLHASLCLNLMHTFGLQRLNLQAMAFGLRYFAKLPGVPAAKLVHARITGTDDGVEEAESPMAPEQFKDLAAFYDSVAVGFVLLKLLFLAGPHGPPEAEAGGAQPPWRKRLLELDVEKEPPAWEKPEQLELGSLSPAELAAQGRVLRGLSAALQGSREKRDLHLTPVRNEHAYFSCIHDILQLPAQPAPAEALADMPRLYAVGDSHVLPLAWRRVEAPAGRQHVVVPLLATGAKLWHLRPASKFYTKYAFWRQIAAVPAGAPVLLVLGEIDCREGILRAVQKGRHASIEAALEAVADLYLALLREVRERLKTSAIFVHPVANVLPETRFLTLAFNQLLAAPKAKAAMEKAGARLLDFPEVLQGGTPPAGLGPLELAKLDLLPELKLDGTHMSPSYVDTHLAPALQAAWPA